MTSLLHILPTATRTLPVDFIEAVEAEFPRENVGEEQMPLTEALKKGAVYPIAILLFFWDRNVLPEKIIELLEAEKADELLELAKERQRRKALAERFVGITGITKPFE